MDFSLNEQEKMLQTLARSFAAKEVAPRAAEIDRSNEFPADLPRGSGSRAFAGCRSRSNTAGEAPVT